MKHRRGARGAAPAFNAATREGRRCPRVKPRLATCFFFFSTTRDDLRRRGSGSVQFALNCAESGCIGHIGRNRRNGRFRMKFKKKKKKKGCETHCLNLITNPKVCFSYTLSRISLHPNPNFSSLILHPSSLCALCGVRSC